MWYVVRFFLLLSRLFVWDWIILMISIWVHCFLLLLSQICFWPIYWKFHLSYFTFNFLNFHFVLCIVSIVLFVDSVIECSLNIFRIAVLSSHPKWGRELRKQKSYQFIWTLFPEFGYGSHLLVFYWKLDTVNSML